MGDTQPQQPYIRPNSLTGASSQPSEIVMWSKIGSTPSGLVNFVKVISPPFPLTHETCHQAGG